MRKLLAALAVLLLALAGWLAFAPVPVDPVAWDAPEDAGYVGRFAPNTELADLERLDMGAEGPEDVAFRAGKLYTATQGGKILSRDLATGDVREIADTGGIPLGLEFGPDGALYVADAALGLVRVDIATGGVETLADEADGLPILYADDVDIHPDGRVFFSDASTRYGAVDNGGTMAASLLEIMEHEGTGRILVWDPATGEASTVADGLVFPNGVAVDRRTGDVLFTVTGDYSVMRLPGGDGPPELVVGNLPGFPDNINPGPELDGEATFLVGLVSPRSADLDRLSGRPALRRVVMRLPEAMRPAAEDYTHIVAITADGDVIASWQDPAGGFAASTGAIIEGGQIYLSSLTEHALATRPAPAPFD